ncbi:MAG TPA: hypothetical protein VLF95_09090 [Vicinamibacteria bacterium]|nr:hypothetical protein [Vicinamibacteria bacterium]
MKRAISLFLAAGLALAGVPAGAQAQEYGPNSVWGAVPQGVEGAVNAVLLDASGKTIAMVPVAERKFAFRDIAPGQYTVGLYTSSGQQIARACPLSLASGGVLEALFTCGSVPAAVAPGGGGISTTAWILMGAAAAGITTAVVIATNDDEGVASPIR